MCVNYKAARKTSKSRCGDKITAESVMNPVRFGSRNAGVGGGERLSAALPLDDLVQSAASAWQQPLLPLRRRNQRKEKEDEKEEEEMNKKEEKERELSAQPHSSDVAI